MIEKYFSAPKTLRRLRFGLSGPYIDGFAKSLSEKGYAHATAIRYLRAAARLGVFVQRRSVGLAEIDVNTLQAFRRHLLFGRCPRGSGGRTGYHAHFGVKLFYRYLIQRGICLSPPPATAPNMLCRPWFHRLQPGIRCIAELLNPQFGCTLVVPLNCSRGWGKMSAPGALTCYECSCWIKRTSAVPRRPEADHLVASIPRYLKFCGEARQDLDRAIPAIAHWRLASLPPCLSADELKRLIAACDGDTPTRRRDRAIILLLSRLGLRAGDVAQLSGPDVDWENGTLQVIGKGRYQVRLPLPQDAGDALVRYLDCRPRVDHTDRIFLRGIAPFRPFVSGDGVSGVVSRALQRAGIEAPTQVPTCCGIRPQPRCYATEYLLIGSGSFCAIVASTCPPTTRRWTSTCFGRSPNRGRR